METIKRKCGIDVGSESLDVVFYQEDKKHGPRQFANNVKERQRLIGWITATNIPVRVVLEATGTYHLDLALELHEASNVEVMVGNPRATRCYAEARMQRAKTDAVDCNILAHFCQDMPFVPWQRPSNEAFETQALARRIHQLNEELVAEKNRLSARNAVTGLGKAVIQDIRGHIVEINNRIQGLIDMALEVIKAHPKMKERFRLLVTFYGIAEKSAVMILAELALLPDEMIAPQLTAYAGLDPRPCESGKYKGQRRISKRGNKYLRKALYFPAMTAVKGQPNCRAYYYHLLDKGKMKMVALVAVMRKLLTSIWGVFRSGQPFDGNKFYKLVQAGTGKGQPEHITRELVSGSQPETSTSK